MHVLHRNEIFHLVREKVRIVHLQGKRTSQLMHTSVLCYFGKFDVNKAYLVKNDHELAVWTEKRPLKNNRGEEKASFIFDDC